MAAPESGSGRLPSIIGLAIIALGILFCEPALARLVSHDGSLEFPANAIAWAASAFVISCGLFTLLRHRNVPGLRISGREALTQAKEFAFVDIVHLAPAGNRRIAGFLGDLLCEKRLLACHPSPD